MIRSVTPPDDEAGTESDRRRPRSVYGVGDEPDPRFSFANERTFLAWMRTSLALLAAAAAVETLDLPIAELVATFVAVTLTVTSLVCAGLAWRGWKRAEQALRRGEPLPSSGASLPLVIGVCLVAVVLLAVSVLD